MKLLRLASLALGLPGFALAASGAHPAGYIVNELCDRVIEQPLKKSESVWDVFQIVVNWLDATYPEKGDARQAIASFDAFIKKFNDATAKDADAKPRTAEMPMSVDAFMKVLRKEAPGGSRFKGRPDYAGNVKAQIYTAMLLPFLQCRGLAYRVRPLAEHSFILHTTAINALRSWKQDLRVSAGANGLAVFEFLTYPLAQSGREPVQFFKFSELQAWVQGQLLPTLDVSIELLEGALAKMGENQKESLDLSTFLRGDNPFPAEEMELAHRYFSKPEVRHLVSRAYAARAALKLACAYNLDDLPNVTNAMRAQLSKNFFTEKVPFGKRPRVGSPPMVRFKLIEKFPAFLTLKDGAQGASALADLRAWWGHFEGAMNAYFAATPGRDDRVVRIEWAQATQRDFLNKVAPQVKAMLQGPVSLTDYIGGATVDVDVPGFLGALPSDLKKFFPSEFDQVAPYWTYEFSSGELAYTNYDYGTPVGWNLSGAGETWTRLFPNLSTQADEKGRWTAPLTLYRDLSRTYGGALLVPALATVVY